MNEFSPTDLVTLHMVNVTDQPQILCYRLTHDGDGAPISGADGFRLGYRTQDVRPWPYGEVIVGKGRINAANALSIVDQLTPYGIIEASAVSSASRGMIVPWVFSFNTKVPGDVVRAVRQRNRGIQAEVGAERRRRAAVSADHLLTQAIASHPANMDVDDVRGTDPTEIEIEQVDDEAVRGAALGEGYRVTREGEAPRPAPRGRGRKAA